MKITYDILQNLLKCNKGMKLVFRDNSNILDVYTNDLLLWSHCIERKWSLCV